MVERNRVTIPAKDWDAFEIWVRRSGEEIPALQALVRTKST